MALFVQKYGGRCVDSSEKIKQAAQRISALSRQGHQIIVVVSAMGDTTNQLLNLAQSVSSHPEGRELDMLLSTGERISASLLSMALHDLNCPAISFTGSQAGIMTDQSHTNAKITAVKPHRVEAELAKGQVVVLAGFQGVCPETKEITTLGRGGSDTTAVAMASHFKAERCEILKDVDGIYSSDPKLVEKAKPIPEVNYQQLYELTFWGAKFLHYRSAELAQELKVPLLIEFAHGQSNQTYVKEKTDNSFFSVNAISDLYLSKNTEQACRKLGELNGQFLLKSEQPGSVLSSEKKLCAISITFSNSSSETGDLVQKALQELKFEPLYQLHDEYTHSLIFEQSDLQPNLKSLHQYFFDHFL